MLSLIIRYCDIAYTLCVSRTSKRQNFWNWNDCKCSENGNSSWKTDSRVVNTAKWPFRFLLYSLDVNLVRLYIPHHADQSHWTPPSEVPRIQKHSGFSPSMQGILGTRFFHFLKDEISILSFYSRRVFHINILKR